MAAAVEFRNVSLRSHDGRSLLEYVTLALEEGTTTALLGRSGSGKTTLLRMVNRMATPDTGVVLVDGVDTNSAEPIALRRSIGYVIQETGLFPHFTVARNIGIVRELGGKRTGLKDLHTLLAMTGLDPEKFAERYPHQLSGGQRQRVGLARALAGDPRILLMDEPFGALDPLTRAEMQDMLRRLLRRLKKTVLLVTHDLNEAIYLASRIVLLEQGHIIADLPPREFLQSQNPSVLQYMQAFRRGAHEAGE
ncbi:ATP-binding cassette domain-containing protein [Acidipila rosea]|uniref:Osmoprotectant transport system ATP-binding protein n=1 Tax=Acidipila rosea TaxID=768535 RepID=A0A4R1LBI4_9BACT|nr:ATP-binding cassette domain-containing protein [Acidipila rosea]TCK75504.1 osmoprotectant transport system ATP-binding protein [Acidipila rosea]